MTPPRTPPQPAPPPRKTGGLKQPADLAADLAADPAPPDALEEARSFGGMTGEGGNGDSAVESPRPERDAGKPGGMIGDG